MSPPRVYIETSIPSFYFDRRPDPAIVVRREATRQWWATAGDRYERVTSPIVLTELLRGPADRRNEWLGLLEGMGMLPVDPPVAEIVRAYARHRLMPVNPAWDAFHLALASYHRCDFLLTWNCRHLANQQVWPHSKSEWNPRPLCSGTDHPVPAAREER